MVLVLSPLAKSRCGHCGSNLTCPTEARTERCQHKRSFRSLMEFGTVCETGEITLGCQCRALCVFQVLELGCVRLP